MAISNPFEPGKLADLSDKINIIPNVWGVINNLGLFTSERKTQRTVLIPRTTETISLIQDRNWNERNQANTNATTQVLPLQIPHFPLDDMILPTDINGVMNWDNASGDSVLLAQARATKMARLRRAHALTLEVARMKMLEDGSVYAPNSTVVHNMYTEFGTNRATKALDLVNTSTSPLGKIQDAAQHIRSKVEDGTVVSEIVAVCSPSFFTALTSHPYVYDNYTNAIQPGLEGTFNLQMRARLGQNVFTFGGITFIEYPASVGGSALVTADMAYAFPMGTESFRTFFAPAERFGDVNTPALESYYFEFPSVKRDKIEIESETNFLNAALNPDAVITLKKAAA